MSIYITGDTHCPIDIDKLKSKNFTYKTTKDDYLIICGDVGIVWYGRDKEDEYWQKWLQSKPWTTLFVDGNHENHAKLDAMPVEEWHGGKVHFIKPNVIHLMRGQSYDIEGKSFFTFGGAESHDKWCRTEDKSWWARELPSQSEIDEAMDNLDKISWNVDCVISHCAGFTTERAIRKYYGGRNILTNFLDMLQQNLEYQKWFFGHYHTDRNVDDKRRAIYNDIIKLEI